MRASNKTRQELPTVDFSKAFIEVVAKFDSESSYNIGLAKVTSWFEALSSCENPPKKLRELSQLADAGYTMVAASGAIDQLLDVKATCFNQPNTLTVVF